MKRRRLDCLSGLFSSDRQSESYRYSVYNHLKQRRAASEKLELDNVWQPDQSIRGQSPISARHPSRLRVQELWAAIWKDQSGSNEKVKVGIAGLNHELI